MGKLDTKTGGAKSPQAAQLSPTQSSEQRRWRAEEALRTATQHMKNTSDTALMKDVQSLAHEQMTHLATVAKHAGGATTRTGSSPDKRTHTGPPKAAHKDDSSGGGSKKQGPRSGKSVK